MQFYFYSKEVTTERGNKKGIEKIVKIQEQILTYMKPNYIVERPRPSLTTLKTSLTLLKTCGVFHSRKRSFSKVMLVFNVARLDPGSLCSWGSYGSITFSYFCNMFSIPFPFFLSVYFVTFFE